MPVTVRGIEIKAARAPAEVGSRSGPILVLGAGETLWADAEPWRLRGWPTMAVNAAGWIWPEVVTHWASLHYELLPAWAMIRARRSDNGAFSPVLGPTVLHSWRAAPGLPTMVWPISIAGYSTLFAVRVALLLGYDRIILIGCPHAGRRLYDCPWAEQEDYAEGSGWHNWVRAARHQFDGRVRSMSGRTRELLGAPDEAWLAETRGVL